MEIRIYDKKNKTYEFKKALKKLGFIRNKNYWVKECDKNEAEQARYFCEKYNLEYAPIKKEYVRSDNYRAVFFKYNNGIFSKRMHYHCAYCGKIKKKQDITIDHLIPINNVLHGKHSHYWRRKLWKSQISDINDYHNLVPACAKCNQKKGSKAGLWVLRGRIGSNFIFWCFYRVIQVMIIIGFIVFLFNMLFGHINILEYFSRVINQIKDFLLYGGFYL